MKLTESLKVIPYPNVKNVNKVRSVTKFRSGLSEPTREWKLAEGLSFGASLVFGMWSGFELQEYELLV